MTNIRQNDRIVSSSTSTILGVKKTPPLDTLAQGDHATSKKTNAKAYDTLQKRAFSKFYTNKILMPLINLKSPMEKKYRSTFFCCKTLEQDSEGKIISKYCKNRWCITCNRIRTAILHNTHKKSLELVNTKFVTLTSDLTKTCVTKEDLESAYALMIYIYQIAWRRMKRKYGKLKAFRKFEVTWKYYRGTFHPHFHIILENNTDEAEFLVRQWLELMPKANVKSQKISNTTENTFNECFKYLCKMWSIKKNKTTSQNDVVLPYPAEKMDNIFEVLKGKRLIRTYNLNDVEIEDFNTDTAMIFAEEIRDNHILWNWEQEVRTWVDYNTGELRTEWKDFTKKQFNAINTE
jgi:hypothetical protein